MRSTRRTLFAVLLLSLFSAFGLGCAATGANGGQVPGTMVATINGMSWSSAYVPGVTTGVIAVHNAASNTLTITGTSVDLQGHTQTLGIVLLQPGLRADTLGLSNTGTYSNGLPGQNSYVTAGYNSGVVSITQYDPANHVVSGTFYFTARQASNPANVVNVSNGSFTNVKWSEQ